MATRPLDASNEGGQAGGNAGAVAVVPQGDAAAGPLPQADAPPTPSRQDDGPLSGQSAGRDGASVAHLAVLTCFLFGIALLKGIRLPNLWAATHMTFNYSQGFVRRGLVGEVIRRLGGASCFHYLPLMTLGIVLFVAVVMVMVLFVRRSVAVAPGDLEYWVAVMVLGASPGIVFFIHEIGYFDYIGVLALLSLVLGTAAAIHKRRPLRFLLFPAVAVAGAVLAFVHEILVAMFIPPLFFAMLCLVIVELRADGAVTRSRWARWVAAAVLSALIPIIVSALVGTFGTKPATFVHAMQAATAPLADFPLRGDAFEVLYKPLRRVLFQQMPYHWSIAENRAYLVAGFYAIAPVVLFTLVYGLRVVWRIRAMGAARAALAAVFTLATIGPLFLCFVGWDNSRWNAISVIDGFCCIGTMRLFFGVETTSSARGHNRWLLTLGAAVIVVGLCTNPVNFLFDGFQVRWFPFNEPFRWR